MHLEYVNRPLVYKHYSTSVAKQPELLLLLRTIDNSQQISRSGLNGESKSSKTGCYIEQEIYYFNELEVDSIYNYAKKSK